VAGKNAEIALGAGHVHLIDLTRKQQAFRRHEAHLEGCHGAFRPFDRFKPAS
jgi:hypothetical protein